MAGHHGQTLPWPVPQEQDAEGKADEDPKEPKVNFILVFRKCKATEQMSNSNLMFFRQSLLCKYFSATFSSTEEEDREVVSY